MEHTVKIQSVTKITHDVVQIIAEKPADYLFVPGQATDVSINKKEWKDKKNPFTFTSLPDNDYLEFTIKTYPSHHGVTNELLNLRKEDELILGDVFGEINYQGEGLFIAGGAGVTPFISILRYLESKNEMGDNKLLFANKTRGDIILEDEFKKLLGNKLVNILSEEKVEGCIKGHITKDLIRKHCNIAKSYFYVCGPPPMMDAVEKMLGELNVNKKLIVKEAF